MNMSLIQTTMLKLGKTQLIQDCRKGDIEMMYQCNNTWVHQGWWNKVTKADCHKLCFGKRELKLPDAKHVEYTGDELRLLDEENRVTLAYYVRHSK